MAYSTILERFQTYIGEVRKEILSAIGDARLMYLPRYASHGQRRVRQTS